MSLISILLLAFLRFNRCEDTVFGAYWLKLNAVIAWLVASACLFVERWA